MKDGRKQVRNRIAAALSTLALVSVGGGVLNATPSFAKPDINDVQSRVDHLYHQAEQASEHYNDARIALRQGKARLTTLRHDLKRQQAKVSELRDQVAGSVVDQYQGHALSTASQVVLSKNPDQFLSQLTTLSSVNDQRAELMTTFATQAKQLQLRKKVASAQVSRLQHTKAKMAKEKAEVDHKAAEAKDLLGKLKAAAARRAAAAAAQQRRESRPSRGATRVATAPATGNAAAAVNYARAQVGKPYVYGASGPDSYDCSGLTMASWAQAGVSLPHSSSAQQSSGTPVSSANLQPGDLVFYYHPVSHVGIYIGNGQVVHAANPSDGVEISGVFSMPYSGAVRPG